MSSKRNPQPKPDPVSVMNRLGPGPVREIQTAPIEGVKITREDAERIVREVIRKRQAAEGSK